MQYIESLLQSVVGTSGGRVLAPAGRRGGRGAGRSGQGRGAPAPRSSSRSGMRADQPGAAATSSQQQGAEPLACVIVRGHEMCLMAPLQIKHSHHPIAARHSQCHTPCRPSTIVEQQHSGLWQWCCCSRCWCWRQRQPWQPPLRAVRLQCGWRGRWLADACGRQSAHRTGAERF